MPTLRVALVPLALAWPCAQREERPAFRVAQGTTLARTFESRYSMALESMRMQLDGEEVPAESLGKIELTIAHSERCTVTDSFLAVMPEGPRRLVRTFDDLGGEEHTTFTTEEGSERTDTRYESALTGARVEFTWDAERAAFQPSYAAETSGDAALLVGLEEDMDLRRWLPREPLAVGASWSIEPSAFQGLLDPGGDLALAPEGQPRADTALVDAQLRTNLAGEFQGTWTATETVDGVRVARIALRLALTTHAEQPLAPTSLPEGGSGSDRIETSFTLQGELRWDLDHGHARALELAGANGLTMIQSVRATLDGQAYEQVQTMLFQGQIRFELSVARR